MSPFTHIGANFTVAAGKMI